MSGNLIPSLLRALARLLAPWRTIRRLERTNKWLLDAIANPTLTGMANHKDNATVGGAGPGPQLLAGMFLGLLQDNPKPSEAQIREALEGNICRCTGYHNIVRAVQSAASRA